MTSQVGKTGTCAQRTLAAQLSERATMHGGHRHPRPHPSSRFGLLCAALAVLALVGSRGAAQTCTVDSDCSAADQCHDAACLGGACVVSPKIDGFGCDDGDICTTRDICQDGTCVGTNGADSDGDGYCDAEEVQAQCNPLDGHEIPPQPNVYSGGRASGRGEVLLAFRAPSDREVRLTPNANCTSHGTCNNASCATHGTCNSVTHFCTSGKISDPCAVDSDCDQPTDPLTHTCRVVINYAATRDLALQDVTLKLFHKPPESKLSDFLPLPPRPLTPGCSWKVDVKLPAGFKRGALRLRATGTTSGKVRKDRDRIVFHE